MEFVAHDFSYYQRTIQKMVRDYYIKRCGILLISFLLLGGFTYFYPEHLFVDVFALIVVAGLIGYLLYQWHSFPAFLDKRQQFLKEHFTEVAVEESEFAYTILENGQKFTVAKKNARNFPSNKQKYTFLVGFSKSWFSKQPVHFFYYDLLELKYEEKYRLKRSGYNRIPRFLRRFTWSNLKSTSSNAIGWLLTNLFVLYMLFRIVTYLLRFLEVLWR